jgi:large subunit ribosomal protein L4e
MKGVLYLKDGSKSEIDLPPHFEENIRPDVIKRAFWAIMSHKYQPKGTKEDAGRDYTAEYYGRTRHKYCAMAYGLTRLPRDKIPKVGYVGRVRNVPQAVGGPVAHPPRPEKVLYEKINKKERILAIRSAIAATANRELVLSRHCLPEDIDMPLVIDDEFENISKTKEFVELLKKLNVYSDIEYAMSKKRTRAGKGKRRGRRYKRKKSILIVVSKPCPLIKAARNLEGVDIVPVEKLNVELLAPGAQPGRFTLWTKGAIEKLYNLFVR